MSVTQSDIDAINSAIASGERLVRKADGTTVEYRSVADLIRARDDLQAKVVDAEGGPRVRATRLFHAGRGFR